MYPEIIMVLVAVRSEYCCCHDLHHCNDFLFSKIFLLNSSFAFLSLSCLNMESAALASSLRELEALSSPDCKRLRCVWASLQVLASPGGFFAFWSCSLTEGADFEAAGVTWAHVPAWPIRARDSTHRNSARVARHPTRVHWDPFGQVRATRRWPQEAQGWRHWSTYSVGGA